MAKGIKGIPDVPSQKNPKKCVKTVALSSGRPEYICPASGGRSAVERLGRLPVRPEDVPRKMLERKIASPEEAKHPKERLVAEAGPKIPKTLHFLDLKEAEKDTPDTLHFKDPQEAKVKKSIKEMLVRPPRGVLKFQNVPRIVRIRGQIRWMPRCTA